MIIDNNENAENKNFNDFMEKAKNYTFEKKI